MTPTPYRVVYMLSSITSIRPTYSCDRALTYLHNWLCAYKTVNTSEKFDRAKVTINGMYKIVHGLSIAAKMFDVE